MLASYRPMVRVEIIWHCGYCDRVLLYYHPTYPKHPACCTHGPKLVPMTDVTTPERLAAYAVGGEEAVQVMLGIGTRQFR